MERRGDFSGSDYTKKTMEETMYWKHFDTVRFSVQLPRDFTTQLMIPKKFTENVKKRLPDKVFLRGPADDIDSSSWEVQLISTSNNTTSIVGEGWNEFVTAYNLKENDTLVFKYKYNAYFKVTMFDAQSCGVEKESSYFVRKSLVPKSDHDENKQEKIANSRKETSLHDPIVLMDKNEVSDQNPRRVDTSLREQNLSRVDTSLREQNPSRVETREQSPSRVDTREKNLRRVDTREQVFEFVSMEVTEDLDDNEEAEIVTPKRRIDDPEWTPAKRTRGELRNARDTTLIENIRKESIGPLESIRKPSRGPLEWPKSLTKARQGALVRDKTPNHGTPSRKREPTDREKDEAWQFARQLLQELPDESFTVIMSPSHVSKTFRLALPKAWTDKYMSASHQDVILRLNGQEDKEWRARYNFDKTRCIGQFTGGWVHFARDNDLHEFDVCVFTLAGRKGGKVCLDVKIIKVIEEEVDEFLLGDIRSGQDMQERRSTHDVVVGLRSMDGRM